CVGGNALGMNGAFFNLELRAAARLPTAQRLAIEQRLPNVPAQILDPYVTEAHLRRFFAGKLVDLQRDEAGLIHRIDKVRAGDAVHPGLDVVAHRRDAVTVPLVVVVRFAAGRPGRELIQPAAARFVVDAAIADGLLVRDLDLVAVDASLRLLALHRLVTVED